MVALMVSMMAEEGKKEKGMIACPAISSMWRHLHNSQLPSFSCQRPSDKEGQGRLKQWTIYTPCIFHPASIAPDSPCPWSFVSCTLFCYFLRALQVLKKLLLFRFWNTAGHRRRRRPSKMSLSVKRSPSVESTGSIVLSNTDSRTGVQAGSSDSQYELYDCSAVLIEYPVHKKFALQRINSKKGYWLPKSVVTPQTGFNIAITSKLKQVLAAPGVKTAKGRINFSPPEIFHYLRLQVPEVKKFVTRCVYKTKLVPEGGACCTATKDLVWVTSAELESAKNMWGPEPGIFIRSMNAGQVSEPLQELTMARGLKPSTVDDAKFLSHCKYAEKDIQRLYCEFIQVSV